jgi:hypothetical protein
MVPGSLFLRKGTSVLFCLPVDRFVQAAVRLTTWPSVSPAAKAPNPVCCRLRPRCCCELLPACCSDCRIPCPRMLFLPIPAPACFPDSGYSPNLGSFPPGLFRLPTAPRTETVLMAQDCCFVSCRIFRILVLICQLYLLHGTTLLARFDMASRPVELHYIC